MRQSHMTVFYEDNGEVVWGDDAQEWWARLAREHPVDRRPYGVMVCSPKAVDYLLHQPETFSSGPEAGFLGSETGLIPLQKDPPEHTRYRKLLNPLFSPRRMEALEPEITRLANRLIDRFIEDGRCDLCADLAQPLPSGAFLRLLGLPLSDLEEFTRVKDTMIRPGAPSVEEATRMRAEAGAWVFDYFGKALDSRSASPTEDVLGDLVRFEQAGELSREETLNICFLVLVAGLDTVADTIGCCFAFLSRHPEHRQALAEDPSLVPNAVEELLRWETPVPNIARVAASDSELEGCPIRKGDRISVLLASVNVDPETFPEPTRVDFERQSTRHFSFGAGVHRCLGSNLARLELKVVLREWHRRIPEYWLAEGHLIEYRPSLREIVSLPLEFEPGARELPEDLQEVPA